MQSKNQHYALIELAQKHNWWQNQQFGLLLISAKPTLSEVKSSNLNGWIYLISSSLLLEVIARNGGEANQQPDW